MIVKNMTKRKREEQSGKPPKRRKFGTGYDADDERDSAGGGGTDAHTHVEIMYPLPDAKNGEVEKSMVERMIAAKSSSEPGKRAGESDDELAYCTDTSSGESEPEDLDSEPELTEDSGNRIMTPASDDSDSDSEPEPTESGMLVHWNPWGNNTPGTIAPQPSPATDTSSDDSDSDSEPEPTAAGTLVHWNPWGNNTPGTIAPQPSPATDTSSGESEPEAEPGPSPDPIDVDILGIHIPGIETLGPEILDIQSPAGVTLRTLFFGVSAQTTIEESVPQITPQQNTPSQSL
jgi:hypothetical protein